MSDLIQKFIKGLIDDVADNNTIQNVRVLELK